MRVFRVPEGTMNYDAPTVRVVKHQHQSIRVNTSAPPAWGSEGARHPSSVPAGHKGTGVFDTARVWGLRQSPMRISASLGNYTVEIRRRVK